MGPKPKKEKKERPFRKRAIEYFSLGVLYGLGQALGLTIIFALIISYFARLLEALGGFPYVGGVLANIIRATEEALQSIKR